MTTVARTFRVAEPRTSPFVQRITDAALLREAWYRVQRTNSSGGVDGVSVRQFRPGVEQSLARLRATLLAGTYKPSPLLRVEIPKPSGGLRALGIPTVADRVVQTAAAMALHERVADLFSDRSFAYRPFMGPQRAAQYLRARIGHGNWVVTADIEKFFDTVEHRVVAAHLRNAGVDEAGIQLVMGWLAAPVRSQGRWFQTLQGLPQGSPISPILANWYLTPFDTALEAEGFTHVRYADDFIVLASDQVKAQRALSFVSLFLTSRLRLKLKPAKTQVSRAEDGFTFVGFRFTPGSWTIPEASLDRFRQAVTTMLTGGTDVASTAKARNDLVQGWRNYYLGNSGEMDAQLE